MDSGKGDHQGHELPVAPSVLAVCAHPDDESFGLGATLAGFTAAGSLTAVLCFTHGESSTLGATTTELGQVRAAELAAAASELGVDHVELYDYPDGGLDRESIDQLTKHVRRVADKVRPDVLLVFDEGGVTGHADHGRATEAALDVCPGHAVARVGMGGRPTSGRHLERGIRYDVRREDARGPRLRSAGRPRTPAPSHHLSCEPGHRQPGLAAATRGPRRPRGAPMARGPE